MEVQHDPSPGRARRRQPARSDQRLHVVGVDDVGAQLGDRRGNLLLRRAPAQERRGGLEARRVRRAPLEQPVRVAGVRDGALLQRDRALLAALQAVAVVEQ